MMKENNLPTIDIGIPALNEEANIKRILESITRQKETNFHIQNIFLISDGSTDNTVAFAKQLQLKNLIILENDKRLGPALSWGRIFKSSTADIVILLDADIELTHDEVFCNLLQPMFRDSSVTLTSGRPIKQSTKAFTDNVMEVSLFLQDYIKLKLQQGSSIYGCHGRITAIRKSVYSQIAYPPIHILGNDSYLYLFNKNTGGKFKYSPDATVLFKMPQTFKDYAKQQRRFTQTQSQHAEIFGQWIYDEYFIPKKLLIAALLRIFIKHPLYTTSYILFQLRSRLFEKDRIITKASWEAPATTKSLD